MHKNEYPWHLPSTSLKQDQFFRHLANFHELTLAWLNEMKVPQAGHFMTRGQAENLSDDLWLLDSITNNTLESLLDETAPDEVLKRLRHTVWVVQSYTILNLLDRAEKEVLVPLLSQASWKLGRLQAEKRLGNIPESDRDSLRTLLAILSDTWFFAPVGPEGYLIQRSIPTSLEFELHSCPHQSPYFEVRPVADILCTQHSHWVKGYIYGLNSKVSVADIFRKPRCSQIWTLSRK